MAKTKKASIQVSSKDLNSKGQGYLTKRITVASAKDASRKAAKEAMVVMGYVITVQGNNIVKKHSSGAVEIVGKIA